MRSSVIFVSLPLLAAGARHSHIHARAHHDHEVDPRALKIEVFTEIVTIVETVTVDYLAIDSVTSSAAPSSASNVILTFSAAKRIQPTDSSQDPHKNTPSAVALSATLSASPSASLSISPIENSGSNPYKVLVPIGGSAMVLNSCDYPVYVTSEGHSGCDGLGAKCKAIAPNSTHIETMRTCTTGGISLKLSKTEDLSKPMQFEYTVWPNDHTQVSYDISYLNCMNGKKDLSDCVGHEGGIQAVGGGDGSDFYCLAGQPCDQQAYTVAEFGYLPGAPVGACKVSQGIAFELCAGDRR
jgi:hypothetical protein